MKVGKKEFSPLYLAVDTLHEQVLTGINKARGDFKLDTRI